MSSLRRPTTTSSSILVVVASVLCGTAGTAVMRLAPDAPSLTVGSMRLLVGATALTATALATGRRPGALRPHRAGLLLGAIAVALYQVCFFTGTSHTGVALATVVALGSAPIFAGLIDAAHHRQAPSARWRSGTTLAITGMALIARGQPGRHGDLAGIAAALAAGLAWATYAAAGQRRIRAGLDSTSCMAAMFTAGAVLSSPFLLVADSRWVATPNGLALSLYLGVATIAIAYTLMGRGLRKLPASTLVTLTLAEPMAAAALAAVVLHQTLDTSGWIGVAVVAVALPITASSTDEPRARPASAARVLSDEPPHPRGVLGREARPEFAERRGCSAQRHA